MSEQIQVADTGDGRAAESFAAKRMRVQGELVRLLDQLDGAYASLGKAVRVACAESGETVPGCEDQLQAVIQLEDELAGLCAQLAVNESTASEVPQDRVEGADEVQNESALQEDAPAEEEQQDTDQKDEKAVTVDSADADTDNDDTGADETVPEQETDGPVVPKVCCPSCGSMVPVDSAVGCPMCGNSLLEQRKHFTRCPECGAYYGEEVAFCMECGHPVEPLVKQDETSAEETAEETTEVVGGADSQNGSAPAEEPVVEQAPQVRKCPSCGRPVKEGDVFCGACGTRL